MSSGVAPPSSMGSYSGMCLRREFRNWSSPMAWGISPRGSTPPPTSSSPRVTSLLWQESGETKKIRLIVCAHSFWLHLALSISKLSLSTQSIYCAIQKQQKEPKILHLDYRQELLVWDMETGDLVKRMTAHFQRIVEIKSLVVGSNNEIITSSIDRCIKIWNLDYIFEKERHIDKHELTIDTLSISTSAGIAVTVTR